MPFNPKTEYHRYQHYFVDIRRLYQKREVVVYTGLTLTLLTIAFFGVFALIIFTVVQFVDNDYTIIDSRIEDVFSSRISKENMKKNL